METVPLSCEIAVTALLVVPACSTGGSADESTTGETSSADTGPESDTNTTGTTSNLDWTEIPGGSFTMGCLDPLEGCDADEQPGHAVTLSDFEISTFEVRVVDYRACVDDGGCSAVVDDDTLCSVNDSSGDELPMNCVDWFQARDFCEWAGASLPTEAQWEFAARSGEMRTWVWGETPFECDLAVWRGLDGQGCMVDGPEAVGTRPAGATAHGVQNMAGNVTEWVADYYDEAYYASSPGADPTGPDAPVPFPGVSDDREVHITRGASWGSPGGLEVIRTGLRRAVPGDIFAPTIGFRCARPSP